VDAFALELARVLGLDPGRIRAVTLRCEPDGTMCVIDWELSEEQQAAPLTAPP
jgi:hypothetical protein